MPTYPTNNYRESNTSTFNNDVTRRLALKDRVAFAQSSRFGGQWMEPKGIPVPYGSTIADTVHACQMVVDELNRSRTLLPDMGNAVLLDCVGVATNSLGVASNIATVSSSATIDGVSLSTSLRVLYYGLTTASFNGVYIVSGIPGGYSLSRASDLTSWWQFVKPKVYLVQQGTNNKATTWALTTDAWEVGPTFVLNSGITNSTIGTSIGFAQSNFMTGLTTNVSLIAPAYSASSNLNTGEYDFLSQDSLAKFMYFKNKAKRLAYWIFKMRENYTPSVSSYVLNVPTAIGLANTLNNIGYSTANNLPAQSRYPSGYNRGF